MQLKIASNEVIHFVGIGGIGMSGLAQIMHNMGFIIQGSDLSQSKNTDRLRKFGIKVFIGHKKKNINKLESKETGTRLSDGSYQGENKENEKTNKSQE